MEFESNDRYYADFETRFRGPKSLVLHRLEEYLPLLAPLQKHTTSFSALDLGCGRGEWLELLQTQGIAARGVDLNSAQLEQCHKLNLTVNYNDAIKELQSVEEGSETLITAFHLVEHLPEKAVRQLIEEALRVLIPGGLLILETPNPDNLSVGSNSFYLDPTHQSPIPALRLQFLVENAGFEDAHILRLNHDPALKEKETIRLIDVIQGVSPDYAVIGIKSGVPHLNKALKKNVKSYEGVTLQALCSKFDQHQELLEQQQSRFKIQLDQLKNSQREYQNLLQQEEHNIRMLLKSSSWRLTKPFRWLKDSLRNLSKKPIN